VNGALTEGSRAAAGDAAIATGLLTSINTHVG
jgi:hypothetical protein